MTSVGSRGRRRVVHHDEAGRATYLAGYGFAGDLPGGGTGSVTVAARSTHEPPWAGATPVVVRRGVEAGA